MARGFEEVDLFSQSENNTGEWGRNDDVPGMPL